MTTADPEERQRLMQLQSIFMPYATKKAHDLYEATGTFARFVHYTSAEAALKIIKIKRIWMRNTTCMSDYSEVDHGYNIILKFFSNNDNKQEFIKVIEGCAIGVATEAIGLFDQLWSDIRFNTYIAAVSEHDVEEDSHGRLSMWRAFGGDVARVAIVINVPWISEGSEALKIQFSPVAYLKEEEVYDELRTVINNVRANSDFLRSVDRQLIVNMIFNMLMIGVVCLKHEGFHEEREWRVIYAPKRLHSPLMESSTEVIGGIPQPVCKIPVDITVSDILSDLDLSKLFDRLIIGPSPYPWAMYESFVAALTEAGVADAGSRVFVSGIPIRT
jgi:hypothetical protein